MRSRTNSTRVAALVGFAALTAGIALCQEAPANPSPAKGAAQAQNSTPRGWRRVTDPAPPIAEATPPQVPETSPEPLPEQAYPEQSAGQEEAPAPPPPANANPADPNPGYRPLDAYGQGRDPYGNRPQYPNQPGRRGPYQPDASYSQVPARPVPPELTIRPGTYLTVRIDQPLSSERNHAGDAFSATLVKPLVVDGVVVAHPGQTLGGRVVEAQKAGRVEGLSRLGVELIDLGLADGQQMPIKTQFVSRTGPTAYGRDAGTIGTTTVAGAITGAAVNGGVGAGVGAAAGLVVGTVGVLLTRGHATMIYPESVLTFRIESPIAISTVNAPQAFRYIEPQEYQRADREQERYQTYGSQPQRPGAGAYYGAPYYPAPYYGPSWYPYSPFYGGLSFYYGPRFYGRGFYGGGFYGGRGGFYLRGYRR